MSLQKTLTEIIQFYVRINYEKHLKDNEIVKIKENEIRGVVNSFYHGDGRKEHIKLFVVNTFKSMIKSRNEEYCGDMILTNIIDEILDDDDMAKNRVTNEIIIYQESKK